MHQKFEEILIPPRVVVSEHKESGAKYVNFPFAFPDGYAGVIVITKGIKSAWNAQDIRKITIEFHDHRPTA